MDGYNNVRGQIPQIDLYSLLGVDRYATRGDISRAWRRLARDYHPDKAGTLPGRESVYVGIMTELNAARDWLTEPSRRREYDCFFEQVRREGGRFETSCLERYLASQNGGGARSRPSPGPSPRSQQRQAPPPRQAAPRQDRPSQDPARDDASRRDPRPVEPATPWYSSLWESIKRTDRAIESWGDDFYDSIKRSLFTPSSVVHIYQTQDRAFQAKVGIAEELRKSFRVDLEDIVILEAAGSRVDLRVADCPVVPNAPLDDAIVVPHYVPAGLFGLRVDDERTARIADPNYTAYKGKLKIKKK